MSRAVLSLGSNEGDRLGHLQSAVDGLGDLVRVVSSVYRTPPWGPVPQPDYYNLVLVAEDDGRGARAWLDRCRALENAAGRDRSPSAVRWGPRTLDADVITVEVHRQPVRSTDPELILPHPRAAERAFVLLPWAEIDPSAVLPDAGPVGDLLDGLDVAGIERVGHVR